MVRQSPGYGATGYGNPADDLIDEHAPVEEQQQR